MSRGPPNVDGLFTLKVDNISYDTRADDMRDVFEKYGEIGDIYIPRDHRSGDSRGFAFVRFRSREDAESAMNKEDGREYRGRELRIQFAKQRRPDDPRQFYSQRDRGYDRGGGYGRGGYDRDRDRGYDRDRDRDRYDSRRRSPSPRRRSRSRSPPRRERSGSNDRYREGGSRSRSRGRDDRR